jgi:hypothetical protein
MESDTSATCYRETNTAICLVHFGNRPQHLACSVLAAPPLSSGCVFRPQLLLCRTGPRTVLLQLLLASSCASSSLSFCCSRTRMGTETSRRSSSPPLRVLILAAWAVKLCRALHDLESAAARGVRARELRWRKIRSESDNAGLGAGSRLYRAVTVYAVIGYGLSQPNAKHRHPFTL